MRFLELYLSTELCIYYSSLILQTFSTFITSVKCKLILPAIKPPFVHLLRAVSFEINK